LLLYLLQFSYCLFAVCHLCAVLQEELIKEQFLIQVAPLLSAHRFRQEKMRIEMDNKPKSTIGEAERKADGGKHEEGKRLVLALCPVGKLCVFCTLHICPLVLGEKDAVLLKHLAAFEVSHPNEFDPLVLMDYLFAVPEPKVGSGGLRYRLSCAFTPIWMARWCQFLTSLWLNQKNVSLPPTLVRRMVTIASLFYDEELHTPQRLIDSYRQFTRSDWKFDVADTPVVSSECILQFYEDVRKQ
jgi:hypothetical protein